MKKKLHMVENYSRNNAKEKHSRHSNHAAEIQIQFVFVILLCSFCLSKKRTLHVGLKILISCSRVIKMTK